MLFQVTHNAVGSGKPEGRATGEHDGVRRVVRGRRIGEMRLARGWPTAGYVDADPRPLVEDEHRHAGLRLGILRVADTQAIDVGNLYLIEQAGTVHAISAFR